MGKHFWSSLITVILGALNGIIAWVVVAHKLDIEVITAANGAVAIGCIFVLLLPQRKRGEIT